VSAERRAAERYLRQFGAGAAADLDRMGGWDQSLRWGGTQAYTFQQLGSAPAAGTPYFASNLLAQPKSEKPRTWSGIMQVTFDAFSEWQGSSGEGPPDWTIEFRLSVGVGQANIIMSRYFVGSPVMGFTPQGAASPLPPFANVTCEWSAVPAAEINAQVILYGTQVGSPAPFSGQMSALFAPFTATEAIR
jgi:hypothetical protein